MTENFLNSLFNFNIFLRDCYCTEFVFKDECIFLNLQVPKLLFCYFKGKTYAGFDLLISRFVIQLINGFKGSFRVTG